MIIQQASINDIEQILRIEEAIEKKNAASRATLISRLKMFPQGFLVAKDERKVLGYIESCKMDIFGVQTFEEIHDFPKRHNPDCKTLYVIFLAVRNGERRKRYGSALLDGIKKVAKDNCANKVQLAAKQERLGFYRKNEFYTIGVAANFFDGCSHYFLEHKII